VGASLLVLVLAVAACDRGDDATPQSRGTPTALDLGDTGTITGTVRFTGEKPSPTTIDATSDPTCAKLHPSGIVVDPIEVSDGGVANVLVYVAHGLEDRVFAVPREPVLIDQRGCLYTPHVAGVQAGQPIRFVNGDDTLHNVHGEPARSTPWNFGLPRRGADRLLVLAKPEVPVPIRCDVHPWMRAYLGVFDHPYFAVTGADGRYTLSHVPAGDVVVATWHERLGAGETTVTVERGTAASADFALHLDRMEPRP
jgi:plastocyanin